ncbi:hypothetical protein B0H14DRAFT_2558310 [Mycena olivaceomarginata]|nr:hypothetical protein B0H14DRAFT_2558310 [Mycena olivaceomarginata]
MASGRRFPFWDAPFFPLDFVEEGRGGTEGGEGGAPRWAAKRRGGAAHVAGGGGGHAHAQTQSTQDGGRRTKDRTCAAHLSRQLDVALRTCMCACLLPVGKEGSPRDVGEGGARGAVKCGGEACGAYRERMGRAMWETVRGADEDEDATRWERRCGRARWPSICAFERASRNDTFLPLAGARVRTAKCRRVPLPQRLRMPRGGLVRKPDPPNGRGTGTVYATGAGAGAGDTNAGGRYCLYG